MSILYILERTSLQQVPNQSLLVFKKFFILPKRDFGAYAVIFSMAHFHSSYNYIIKSRVGAHELIVNMEHFHSS